MKAPYLFKPLTESFLAEHIQDFTRMARRNIVNEYWEATHFLAPLNKKWEYSFYVQDHGGTLVGFLVASQKEQSIHIHKFVVDSKFQRGGIGSRMVDHLLQQSSRTITLKVDQENAKAISFYKQKGFVIVSEEKNMFTMALTR
jgi:ribosomal protein S18 acetylase RimI-like enzyme